MGSEMCIRDRIGDSKKSDRFAGISWSHSVFNLQKSRGAVMGGKVNGDRSFPKWGKYQT